MKHHTNGAKVVQKARELYDDSKDRAVEELDRANSFIHEKPVLSAVIGVGLGFFLASLFRSRD